MTRTASIPRATYRVQLNREFRFNDAMRIVPYLARLGISHLYTSPILKARPGSTHGYDVVDHTVLNPELGTREEFEQLVAALHEHGMRLLVDIVPNHLGIMGSENAWWLDLLENGPSAQAADFFDVDWRPNRPSLRNRVLVPVLGNPYGTVLEQGELKVEFDAARGSFHVRYHENCFPIDPREYPRLFERAFAADDATLPPDHPDRADFESLLTTFANLPRRDDDSPEARALRYRDKEAHKRRLVRLIERSPEIRARIDVALAQVNGKHGTPESFDALDRLLDSQAYRLAFWRVAGDEINYRRFFDVNDLAALRMNDVAVFDQTHALIFELVDAGMIDGLRIDHSDGLFDPRGYFERLQQRYREPGGVDKPLYVVTEKILATHERLPAEWQVHGTTGYDFTALVAGWLVCADHEETMTRQYRNFTGVVDAFEDLAYQCKKLVMGTSLAAEVEVLATQLDRLAQLDRHTADYTRSAMHAAIVEVIARFPVYRTYVSASGISDEDRRIVQRAINIARSYSTAAERTIYDFLRDVLLGDAAPARPEAHALAMLEFAMKFQQVTSPVTAKGIEDTAFYRYNRLVALNEVGGDPRRFSFSNGAVHQENLERSKSWPHSMLASSTHDTKRSEDARARIAVLSELPELWKRHTARWSRLNRSKRRQLDTGNAPTRNDEYLIYQNLLGIWTPQESPASLVERMQAYLVKATREAKHSTSWMNPNPAYEEAVAQFAARLFENPEQNAFLRDFATLAETVNYFGHLNALTQTVLKLTSPGVPDIYQGTEVTSLALVDPDNRRPVDFVGNDRLLGEISGDATRADLVAAANSPYASTAKMIVTWRLLQLRQRLAELFELGSYEPLQVAGIHKEQVLAFSRTYGGLRVVVVLARWMGQLMDGRTELPVGEVWGDTSVSAPRGMNGELRDVFVNRTLEFKAEAVLRVADVFRTLPFAVFVNQRNEL